MDESNCTIAPSIPDEISSTILKQIDESADVFLGQTVKDVGYVASTYFHKSHSWAANDSEKNAGINQTLYM